MHHTLHRVTLLHFQAIWYTVPAGKSALITPSSNLPTYITPATAQWGSIVCVEASLGNEGVSHSLQPHLGALMMSLSLWDLNTASSPPSLFIRWFLKWPSLNRRSPLTMHSLLLARTASLSLGLQLTYDVSLLPAPDHSPQILDLGENTCSLKKILGQENFTNHTLCPDPSRTKLFSSFLSLSQQPALLPNPSHPAMFTAPCNCIHLYLSSKSFVVQGPSLASPNFPFLPPSPSPPFHAVFLHFHSSCHSKLPSLL